MKAQLDRHAAHFDALYRADHDPWDYETSLAEAAKRRAIVGAIGGRPAGTGLEIGCGNGKTTEAIAPRFARLTAIDGAAKAVRLARRRLAGKHGVRIEAARLPEDFPRGAFDTILASEVLYYLPRAALEATAVRIDAALRPGGRLICVNALAGFSDRELGHGGLADFLLRAFGPPERTVVGAGWRLDLFVRRRKGARSAMPR